MRRLLASGVVVLGAAVAAAALAPRPAAAGAPCHVAFVHGSGEDFHDQDEAAIERYWSADGSPWSSFTFYGGRQWAGADGCAIVRVGYDGNAEWWSHRAAGRVAARLAEFIAAHDVPDGGLVIVGHSMGGVVARYLVNSGMPGAPYYNEYVWLDPRMDYDLVRRKTAYVVTVQSPHTGSQGADALYGDADHALTSSSAALIKILGLRETTSATAVMTRAYMEAAGVNGGEMGDEGRVAPLYTVAGTSAKEGSGNGMEADGRLDLAWALLCYHAGPANSWGAACRWDAWNFGETAGDGLVEWESAHGLWTRRDANGRGAIAGARQPWLDVEHNHNHGRYDAHPARIDDYVGWVSTTWYLGSYVGELGLGLPGAVER